MYDVYVRMVVFRIEWEWLEFWIKVLYILYYDYYGKINIFMVNWYDEFSEWVIEDNKLICIDLVKY